MDQNQVRFSLLHLFEDHQTIQWPIQTKRKKVDNSSWKQYLPYVQNDLRNAERYREIQDSLLKKENIKHVRRRSVKVHSIRKLGMR